MLKKPPLHLLRGQRGERSAARYLQARGLRIVAKNVRTRGGEIDLIARDGEVLVFVEVRLRRAGAQVSAGESITAEKRRRWKNAAEQYLQKNFPQPPDCRFDAVLVTDDGAEMQIEWLRGLFI